MLPMKIEPIEPSRSSTHPSGEPYRSRNEAAAAEHQGNFERLVNQPREKNSNGLERNSKSSAAGRQPHSTPQGTELEGTSDQDAQFMESLGEGAAGCDSHTQAGCDHGGDAEGDSMGMLSDGSEVNESEASIVYVSDDDSSAGHSSTESSAGTTVHALNPVDLFSRGNRVVEVPQATGLQTGNDQRMVALAQQVADRILVSEAGGLPQEVRIQIRESILPGTEVRIVQQAGQLQVHLLSDQQRSIEMLQLHQASLAAQLDQRLSRDVVVHVELTAQDHTFQRDDFSRNQQQSEHRESPGESRDDEVLEALDGEED